MRVSPYFVLSLGVLAASSAATIIRLCDAPSLVIAAYRLLFATGILLPFTLVRAEAEIRHWPLRDGLAMTASGICLALHFALWISSLKYTSVASSVLLVSTTPLFVGLGAWIFLREPITLWTAGGITVAFFGSAIIAVSDLCTGSTSLHGDLLALGGAVAMACHLLIGRRLRQRISNLPYVTFVNGIAALVLIAGSLVADAALGGYSPRTYLLLLLLALFPQIVGHSSFNWALQKISPSFISIVLLGEPIIASLAAYLILAEVPPAWAWVGGPVVLAGIVLAAHGEDGQRMSDAENN